MKDYLVAIGSGLVALLKVAACFAVAITLMFAFCLGMHELSLVIGEETLASIFWSLAGILFAILMIGGAIHWVINEVSEIRDKREADRQHQEWMARMQEIRRSA